MLKTTRENKFNFFYTDDKSTVNSLISTTAASSTPNIRLLDSSNYVIVSGELIKSHAAKNTNLDSKNEKYVINTDNISKDKDYYVFGAPHKMVLDNRQQFNNCGIDSTLNNLVMAGKLSIKDQNKTETEFTRKLWEVGMIEDDGFFDVFDTSDGGTLPPDYKEIFEYYGIKSDCYYVGEAESQYSDINKLGYLISQGHTAIIAVCSYILWQGAFSESSKLAIDHAISITGVVYDTQNPTETTEPKGFYVHDTGAWMSRYITLKEFKEVTLYDKTENTKGFEKTLNGKTEEGIYITITTNPVKFGTDNVNATGNAASNTIYGNSSDNKIKGLGGNDYLYGGAGNDYLWGGSGNDVIFGNGVNSDDVSAILTETKTYMSDSEYSNIKTALSNVSYVKSEAEDKLLTGRNFIYGGKGNDIIIGGNQNDSIDGDAGNDIIYSGGGKDLIHSGKGNDYIFSGSGDDRIYAGAGNDVINAGKGDDIIDCGSGNDTVILDNGHGADNIFSSSGTLTVRVTHKTIDDIKIEAVENDYNSKIRDINFGYKNDNSDEFSVISFLNLKNNKSKNVTLETVNLTDPTKYDSYTMYGTSSQNAKVKDINGNNILFVARNKDSKITTSEMDDIVYTTGKDIQTINDRKKDTITYTGGRDTYFSLVGNTNYVISDFSQNTNLSIYDSTGTSNNYYAASTNDSVNFNTDNSNNIKLLFDMTKDGEVTENNNLYVLHKDVALKDTYKNIASGQERGNGIIGIEDFFDTGRTLGNKSTDLTSGLTLPDYYGNGRIEYFYTNGNTDWELDSKILSIKSEVTAWLTMNNYDSVFNALSDETISEGKLNELIGYYTDIK